MALGGVCFVGVYCNHLEGTLLQPQKGEDKTLDASLCGVGLRAGGFGPRPLASKQASKKERNEDRKNELDEERRSWAGKPCKLAINQRSLVEAHHFQHFVCNWRGAAPPPTPLPPKNLLFQTCKLASKRSPPNPRFLF